MGLRWDASRPSDAAWCGIRSRARCCRSPGAAGARWSPIGTSSTFSSRPASAAAPCASRCHVDERPRAWTRTLLVAASAALVAACARPATPGPAGIAGRPPRTRPCASRSSGALLRHLSGVLGHARRLGRGAVRRPPLRGGHRESRPAACRRRESTAWWRRSPRGGISTSPIATPPASPAASGMRPTCPGDHRSAGRRPDQARRARPRLHRRRPRR